ncbi:MAG TPA: glycosyltransferase [Bacteroidales bacterium]|nr:glycosyltransferase [Bacteroidales bacterium]
MRILLIIKNFDFGGAENHVRELANSLSDSGNELFVIAGPGRQTSLLRKGVQYTRLRKIFAPAIIQTVFIILFLHKHKIQVIHAHQRLPALVASIAGRLTSIPVVVTVHGRTRFDLRSWISRSFPSKIIFVSRHVLEVSAKYEQIKEKSVIIPNWIVLPKKTVTKIPYSISYISRIDKKHSSLILMIIKEVLGGLTVKYPYLTFRIIGEGDYLDEIRKEAELFNRKLKRETVVICGFVLDPREKLLESELVIGVGRVALEALSCGIPVLSMNRQRMGSLVSRENYQSFQLSNFVAAGSDPPDRDALLKELDKFLSDIEFWQKEADLLREKITSDYNTGKITGEIISIYRSLIK